MTMHSDHHDTPSVMSDPTWILLGLLFVGATVLWYLSS
jgi:hypothetical protein